MTFLTLAISIFTIKLCKDFDYFFVISLDI